MGKSRVSPLTKTSGISVGGIGGGFGTGSGKAVTQLSVGNAQPQQVALNSQAQRINNANFSDTDNADYHQLYNGRQYFQNQAMSIDQRIATINYLSDVPSPNSQHSMSQNMNWKMENGLPISANERFTFNNLESAMHNLGYNLTLQRFDHANGINSLLSAVGINKSYDTMTESQLKSALVGLQYKSKSLTSTSYNDFKNAPTNNPFTNRALKIIYNAKANTQAFMPGNGPGGNLGEMLLSTKNKFKVTDVKFDTSRTSRHKGSQTYTAKSVTLYVDVES